MNMSQITNISFQPNWKILLLGRSHFHRPADAIAEFIDNSIQACMLQDTPCQIQCHVVVEHREVEENNSLIVVLDNGIGMNAEGIKQFATFAESPTDRRLAPSSTNSQEDKMFISKFGVGAKQAGFYLGDRITILSKPASNTKKDNKSSTIYRFSLDEKKLEDDAQLGNPFEGIVEEFRFHPNDDDFPQRWLPTINVGETTPRYMDQIEAYLRSHFQRVEHGTAIVIRLRKPILDMMRGFDEKDDHFLDDLSYQLKDIYHFHLNPDEVSFKNPVLNGKFQSTRIPKLNSGKEVDIEVCWHRFSYSGNRNSKQKKLKTDVNDFLDQCNLQGKKPYEAVVTLPASPTSPQLDLFAFLWYLPFQDDQEQMPQLLLESLLSPPVVSPPVDDDASRSLLSPNESLIRCYWQNRLVPFSVLHRLPFMENVEHALRNAKQHISTKWRSRIVGILFFDWQFHDIANNKLRFSCDIIEFFNQNKRRLLYTPSVSSNAFAKWLHEECAADEEFLFSDGKYVDGKIVFSTLKYIFDKKSTVLCAEDTVKLKLLDGRPDLTDVKIIGFQTEHAQNDLTSCYGGGHLLFQRLPVKLYGGCGHGSVATKTLSDYLVKKFTPHEATYIKITPHSIAFTEFTTPINSNVISENRITIVQGTLSYKWGIQLKLKDLTYTWHLPNLPSERYIVELSILDSARNLVHECSDNNLYMFDVSKDSIKFPTHQSMAEKCYYSFYNMYQAPFTKKCGKYKMLITVYNPDRSTNLLEREFEVNVLPPEIARVEVIPFESKVQLGQYLPPLRCKFYDKLNNPIILQNEVNVQITCEDLNIKNVLKSSASVKVLPSTSPIRGGGVSIKSSPQSEHQKSFILNGNTWQIFPVTGHPVLNGKLSASGQSCKFKISFSTTSSSSSSSGAIIPWSIISLDILPGSPHKILPTSHPKFKIDGELKSLHLVVTDEWGNRVLPKGENWSVICDGGPCVQSNPSEIVLVDTYGDVLFHSLNVVDVDMEYYGAEISVPQGFTIVCLSDNRIVVPRQEIPIIILPNHIPTLIQILWNEMPLIDQGGVIECQPKEMIENISYKLLDENGNQLILPPTATMKCTPNWRTKNVGKRRKDIPAKGFVPNIEAPKEVGEYEIEVKIMMDKVSLTEDFRIKVNPGTPCQWELDVREDLKRCAFIGGEIEKGLSQIISGAYLLDEYKNCMSITEMMEITEEYQPMLMITLKDNVNRFLVEESEFHDDDQMKKCVLLPFALNTSSTSETTTRYKKKRKADDGEVEPTYVIPVLSSDDPAVIKLNKTFIPGDEISIKVYDTKSVTNNTQPSKSFTKTIEFGRPHQLKLTTITNGIMNPTINGKIVFSRTQKLNDIQLHVYDCFNNQINIKDYSLKSLLIFVNDELLQSFSKIDNHIDLIQFLHKIEISDDMLQGLIKRVRMNAVQAGNNNAVISLRFVICLIHRVDNSLFTLQPAQLQCSLRIANNIIGIEMDLLHYDTREPLERDENDPNTRWIIAGNIMPRIALKLITEDGQEYIPDNMNAFQIELTDILISQQCEEPSTARDVFVNGEIQSDGKMKWFELQPSSNCLVDNTGVSYRIHVKYNELRSQLGLEKLEPTAALTLIILPDCPKDLVVNPKIMRKFVCIVSASSEQSQQNEIASDISVSVVDKCGNAVGLPTSDYELICQIANKDGNLQDLQLPKLQSNRNDGVVRASKKFNNAGNISEFIIPRLALSSENNNAMDEKYSLLFTLLDKNRISIMHAIETFQLTSNLVVAKKLQEIQDKKKPLQEQLARYRDKCDARDVLLEKKQNILSTHDHLENIAKDDLMKRITHEIQQLKLLEAKKLSIKIARKVNDAEDNMKLLELNEFAKEKIIGQIVDCAIADPFYDDILSLACQQFMDTWVVADVDTAMQIVERGLKAISLDMCMNYMRKDDDDLLQLPPIELPLGTPAPGNPKYMVNLLHFDPRKKSFRSSLFYSLFRNSIVFNSFQAALNYRQYLIEENIQPPMLYSLDGRCIGVDGVLVPLKKAMNMADLSYRFGEWFSDEENLKLKQEDVKTLEQLIKIEEDLMSLSKDIHQISIASIEPKLVSLDSEWKKCQQLLHGGILK